MAAATDDNEEIRNSDARLIGKSTCWHTGMEERVRENENRENQDRCADHRRRYGRMLCSYVIGKKSGRKVLIAEKANIKRSGCLAAGVNALNAYITEGRVPQDYVDYAKKDAHGIVREDLLLTMSERLNHVTKVMEDLGLVILKDENGKYVARGNRNIKINGENMKPILAKAAAEQENVTVLNHVNITDYKTENKKSQAQLDLALMRIFSMTLMRKQFFVPQVVQRDFTDRINPGFPDIRCGILRLTQVQDMQWDFFPVRR